MVISPWRIALVGVACALVSDGIAAQKPPPLQNPAESKRPRLPSAADTNDWAEYFDYGVSRLRNDPRGAERAFYWASRLEPSRAEPLYGRWVAYWMRFPGWFEEYVAERPRVLESPNVLQVDSLYQRALLQNPLMPRTLHVLLYDQLPGEWQRDPLTIAVLDYGAKKFDAAAATRPKTPRLLVRVQGAVGLRFGTPATGAGEPRGCPRRPAAGAGREPRVLSGPRRARGCRAG